MRRNKREVKIKVGAFIFIGLLCLFGSIFFLGKNQTFFSWTSLYKIKFQQVDGLFVGSVVGINGIPAGNVLSIDFIKETNQVEVNVAILQKFANLITNQSVATLVNKGLLGDKYVSITTTQNNGMIIPEGGVIPSHTQEGLLNLLSRSTEAQKISQILSELLQLFQTLRSEQTMVNFSKLFSPENTKNISEILKRLNSVLTKVDKGEGTVGALINNKKIYHSVLSILGHRPYHKYLPNLIKDIQKK